jgi:hypothetical protein
MSMYQDILDELAEGELNDLQKQVYHFLKIHPDGLTRQQLVEKIYGYTPENLSEDKGDRKVRRAIEQLRGRLFPIVSNSSQAGYKLDVSREAVRRMVSDLQSRRDKLTSLITAAAKFYEIPAEYVDEPRVSQVRMF